MSFLVRQNRSQSRRKAELPASAAWLVAGLLAAPGGRALERLAAGNRLPVGLTADGRLVLAAPLEQVFWVEGMAAARSAPAGPPPIAPDLLRVGGLTERALRLSSRSR